VHQAADQGVPALLRAILEEGTVEEGTVEDGTAEGHTEGLADGRSQRLNNGLQTDPSVLRLLEAAVRLGREDLVAKPLSVVAATLLTANRASWESLSWQQIRGLLDLLDTAIDSLEQIDGIDIPTLARLACTLTIGRVRQLAREADREVDGYGNLGDPVVAISALLRVAARVDPPLLKQAQTVSRRVVTSIAGEGLHRLVILGGDPGKVAQLLEAIALLSFDKRRPWYRVATLQLFDEIAYTRLYVTGAIAQQATRTGHHRLVRAFGANHIDGHARTCTTLAWLRALQAVRPLLATEPRETQEANTAAPEAQAHPPDSPEGFSHLGRLGEADRIIERIVHNALLVAPGTDPTRWLGPIPHGIDRNEESDLFGGELGHQFAPGPWRPNLRSPGTVEQCCAASALNALALVPALSVSSSEDQLVVHQLTPGETVGEGWELTITGGWPFEADLSITVHTDQRRTVYVRVPDWHDPVGDRAGTDGNRGSLQLAASRWLRIEAGESEPCHLPLEFPAVPRLVAAHPLHSDIRGCVAMISGPFVYCLEGADQSGHLQPRQVRFDVNGAVSIRRETEHPEGNPTIHATGEWRTRDPWTEYAGDGQLGYRWWRPEPVDLPVDLTFVPYYTIANRGLWEMALWIPLAVPSDS
jgi:hypothetical protein